MFAGSVDCEKGNGCCLYAGPKGETLRAELGDRFDDGCNEKCKCTQTKDNRGPWRCKIKRKCSCKFKNWDRAVGYATSGESVPVFEWKVDEMYGDEYGCHRMCTCQAKRPGKKEKIRCEGEPCLAFQIDFRFIYVLTILTDDNGF